MDTVKARELNEVYDAIRGAYPRGDGFEVAKLAAEVVVQGKKAPDPHRTGLNAMAVRYANSHKVDLLVAYPAVYRRYSEIFVDPDLTMRHMADAQSAAAGQDDGGDVAVRKIQELANANDITFEAQVARLVSQRTATPTAAAPTAPTRTVLAPNDARPARVSPVQAIEDRGLEVADQAGAINAWADDEAARSGKSPQKAMADHVAARLAAANERNTNGRSRK